jgi:hypothetical protein
MPPIANLSISLTSRYGSFAIPMVLQKKHDHDNSGSGEAFAVTDRLKPVLAFGFQTD